MSYIIEITPEAHQEIAIVKQWYDEQQLGLGEDFVSTVKLHIDSLKSGIVEYKFVFDDVGRSLVKRFPYVVYYKRIETTKTVKIMAVLHERQERKF
jgi:plasmid stabilization system protein ParE